MHCRGAYEMGCDGKSKGAMHSESLVVNTRKSVKICEGLAWVERTNDKPLDNKESCGVVRVHVERSILYV